MGFLEEEVAKYERRIRKLEQNPDPNRLGRSTRMRYELEMERRKAQLKALEEGWPPLAEGLHIEPFWNAFGIQYLDMLWMADMIRPEEAARYYEKLRGLGLPDDICDRTVVFIAMAASGDLPLPNIVVTENHACLAVQQAFNFVSRWYNIPFYGLDLGYEGDVHNLDYIVSQVRDMIDFVERTFPGVKFDEEKFRSMQDIEREGLEYYREMYELRKRIPSPISGRDAVRQLRPPTIYPDPVKGLEYLKCWRDEMRERADRGISGCPNERLRIAWCNGNPFYGDQFEYLNERGVATVVYIMGNTGTVYGLVPGTYGDEKQYGRKLSPLEELARAYQSVWGTRPASAYAEQVIAVARDLSLDGIVYYLESGCPPVSGIFRIVADEVERQLEIPVLVVQGRQLNQEGYNPEEFHATLDQFIERMELSMQRKR